jgi:hypothetical protein
MVEDAVDVFVKPVEIPLGRELEEGHREAVKGLDLPVDLSREGPVELFRGRHEAFRRRPGGGEVLRRLG